LNTVEDFASNFYLGKRLNILENTCLQCLTILQLTTSNYDASLPITYNSCSIRLFRRLWTKGQDTFASVNASFKVEITKGTTYCPNT